ncbi:MAG: hypothetical protein WCI92_14110 [Bacteroidota bacterium]
MKVINAIYKHRHLYNVDTRKRIILDENSEISITVNENSILKEDPYNPPHTTLLTRKQLIDKIEKENLFFRLFLEKGSKLWFTVNAGEKVKKDKTPRYPSDEIPENFVNNKDSYLFEIELQEDLFWVSNEQYPKKADVYSCACTVIRECHNQLHFFEPIYSPSLNQAYTRTFEFYFPLYASANASIYNKILVHPHNLVYLKSRREGLSFLNQKDEE